jgi:hypothetical protein
VFTTGRSWSTCSTKVITLLSASLAVMTIDHDAE